MCTLEKQTTQQTLSSSNSYSPSDSTNADLLLYLLVKPALMSSYRCFCRNFPMLLTSGCLACTCLVCIRLRFPRRIIALTMSAALSADSMHPMQILVSFRSFDVFPG